MATIVLNTGLTTEEQKVMDALVLASNEWHKLPEAIAQDEMRDFIQAIHTAQMVLAGRIVRRAYPDYWR